jgi:muramoyltetrapeptide carboxypeptidase
VLDRTAYLAGADVDRAADLADAWLDPQVRGVLCARGGYGAVRLLEHLDWGALAAAAPKVLVGASDVTVLHEAVGRRLGVVTLFGPMPATEVLAGASSAGERDPGSAEHLRATLFGAQPVIGTDAPVELVAGRAAGTLVGGTLALLAAALGTPYAGTAAGGIAVLEDVGEAPYRLDRLATQLLHAGWFDGVRGVVLGTLTRCGEGALDVLHERLSRLGVPVLAGFPVGHGPTQLTLPLGVEATLDTGAGTLTLAQPPLG